MLLLLKIDVGCLKVSVNSDPSPWALPVKMIVSPSATAGILLPVPIGFTEQDQLELDAVTVAIYPFWKPLNV